MPKNPLKEQAAKIKQDLVDQGRLDKKCFNAVERNFGDDPRWHEIMYNMFINNSAHHVGEAEQTLQTEPIDFRKLTMRLEDVRQVNWGTGAKKVKELCNKTTHFCIYKDAAGCHTAFQELKTEHTILQNELRTYFELVKRANASSSGASSSGASGSGASGSGASGSGASSSKKPVE